MSLKMEIRVLSPGGDPIELTLEEAKELYLTLAELFKNLEPKLVLPQSGTPGAR